MTERTLTLSIKKNDQLSLEELRKTVTTAWQTGKYQGEYRAYSSPEQLFRIFTPARWGVLETLQQQSSSIGLRSLARLLQRDPTAVLRDLTALAEENIIEKDETGKWLCPFQIIHTDFTLYHAA
jgi:predicted transcriptional regulator